MPLWAALVVFPLYRLGGRLAAAWWPLIPALALFTGTWNTLYAVLALVAYAALHAGLNRSKFRAAWFILSGAVVSIATFTNISVFPLIGLLGLYTLIAAVQQQDIRAALSGMAPVGV